MLVKIEINCFDDTDIMTHLSVIRQQIRHEFKKYRKENPDEKAAIDIEIKDSNCYGDHVVTITEPEMPA